MATSFAAAKAQAKTIAPPEPEPLGREIAPAAPYPVDALGDTLSPFVKAVREIIQAPAALVAQSVLAAAAHAVQGHVDVAIDGRLYPTSLYFITIAESGERKTAADTEATRTHLDKQEAEWPDYAKAFAVYMACVNGAAKDREAIVRAERDPQARKEALEQVENPGPPPLSPAMILDEPTYEGIYKHFFAQPSLGLFSNEGGQFVGGYAMSETQSMKTLGALNKLWDGLPINRSRGTDGTSMQFGRRLSLHLMVQPVVAHTLLGHQHAHGMGFLARCLTVYPPSTMGTRLYKADNLLQRQETITYLQRVRAILEHALPLQGDTNDLAPRPLALGAEAKKVWVAFHDRIERNLADGKCYEPIRAFACKAAEHALRIAGVLTILDRFEAQGIPAQPMEAAITLAQYYVDECLRLSGSSGESADIVLAKKLVTWLQDKEFRHFYLAQVYQYGPHGIRNKATAAKIVALLETHHIVTRVPEGMHLDGKDRAEVWEVHHV